MITGRKLKNCNEIDVIDLIYYSKLQVLLVILNYNVLIEQIWIQISFFSDKFVLPSIIRFSNRILQFIIHENWRFIHSWNRRCFLNCIFWENLRKLAQNILSHNFLPPAILAKLLLKVCLCAWQQSVCALGIHCCHKMAQSAQYDYTDVFIPY